MRKLHLLSLSCALALALTACGATQSSPTPAVSPTPTPVEIPAVSPSLAAEEHLEFYDQFEWYNSALNSLYHHFAISEAEVNGQLQYCFTSKDETEPVTILVDPRPAKGEPWRAHVVSTNDSLEPITFEMPIFILGYGNVSGVADFYLQDLTGDEKNELIYIYGAGGTGVWQDRVKVFDLTTHEEYLVAWDSSVLKTALPDGMDGWFGSSEGISLTPNGLVLDSRFSDGELPLNYIGQVTAPFAFDGETGTFGLTTPYELTLYENET